MDETQGLKAAHDSLVQTRFISFADSIWVRIRPEFTTDKEVERIDRRLKPYRNSKTIINDVAFFHNYDSKDRTFELWHSKGISCPEFLSLSLSEAENNIDDTISKIKKFVDKHGKVFMRTNNETAANGMFLLDKKSSVEFMVEKTQGLVHRCKTFINKRKNTRIVLVEFIKPDNKDGNIDLYRVHLLLGNILSYYAVTAKLDIFHNCDMDERDLDRFINLNRSISKIVEKHKNTILEAAEVLGCNLGAIEFFVKDGSPIFLEFNPMWGGQASKVGFGNVQIQDYLDENRKDLIEQIPNIYSFLDYKNYYKTLFKSIHNYCKVK